MNPEKIMAELLASAITTGSFGGYTVTYDGANTITIDIRNTKETSK